MFSLLCFVVDYVLCRLLCLHGLQLLQLLQLVDVRAQDRALLGGKQALAQTHSLGEIRFLTNNNMFLFGLGFEIEKTNYLCEYLLRRPASAASLSIFMADTP